jgi:hypothetical protein
MNGDLEIDSHGGTVKWTWLWLGKTVAKYLQFLLLSSALLFHMVWNHFSQKAQDILNDKRHAEDVQTMKTLLDNQVKLAQVLACMNNNVCSVKVAGADK